MNILIKKLSNKYTTISKLYYDLYHKSSLGVLSTLLIIMCPEYGKVYKFSEITAIYTVILIFSDFGINQLFYQYFSKVINTPTRIMFQNIYILYATKLSLNLLFALCLGGYLKFINIFDFRPYQVTTHMHHSCHLTSASRLSHFLSITY